jgi:hypothetical protein
MRDALRRELQGVLSSRFLLALLGGMARRQGTAPPLILKGAVPLALGRPPLALADVDVLLPPADAARLAELIAGGAAGGERRRGGVHPGHHLPPTRLEGHVPVEFHTRLKVGSPELQARLVGAGTLLPSGVSVPDPVDHADVILHHGVVHHPDRRGSLREVLLLADALGALDAGGEDELRARIGQAPPALRAPLHCQLDAACRIAGPGADPSRPVPPDPFPEVAAVVHLVVGEALELGLPRAAAIPLVELALGRLGHGTGETGWSRRTSAPSRAPTGLERASPSLARLWRLAARMGGLAALELPARTLVVAAGAEGVRARLSR